MKLILLTLVFLIGGCANTHDVSQAWPHNPKDIDELVIHMDEKINRIIECEGDQTCMNEIIGR